MSAVFAIVSFCGRGTLTLYSNECNAREALQLLKCGPGCTNQHKLIRLGDVIA